MKTKLTEEQLKRFIKNTLRLLNENTEPRQPIINDSNQQQINPLDWVLSHPTRQFKDKQEKQQPENIEPVNNGEPVNDVNNIEKQVGDGYVLDNKAQEQKLCTYVINYLNRFSQQSSDIRRFYGYFINTNTNNICRFYDGDEPIEDAKRRFLKMLSYKEFKKTNIGMRYADIATRINTDKASVSNKTKKIFKKLKGYKLDSDNQYINEHFNDYDFVERNGFVGDKESVESILTTIEYEYSLTIPRDCVTNFSDTLDIIYTDAISGVTKNKKTQDDDNVSPYMGGEKMQPTANQQEFQNFVQSIKGDK